ncbi:MAG: type IV pilus assembly protein PilM [Clostridia bacterium]|nr:type IV pilus assembly protein PilM [Clostridia bacterium]
MQNRAIGLEIDTGTARVVELTGKAGAPNLANLGSITLPEGAVKEGLILQPDLVGAALKKLWQKAGFSKREVILGVSNQSVLVRHITIPKMPMAKIKNVIMYQAQEYLPIPLESVVLDYLVLGETAVSGNAEITLDVILVAAKRDMLENFLEALKIAHLEPLDIDVSSIVLISLLPQKAMRMTVALVNVANGQNSILVSAEGKPRLARLGLVKVNDLADNLGCPLDKISYTQADDDSRSAEILANWIDNLAKEIRSSLTYYQDQPGSSRIEGILLSGRGALFRGVAEQLEEYLDLPVRNFNPLGIYAPAKRRLLRSDSDALEFAVSTGLAIRGLEG